MVSGQGKRLRYAADEAPPPGVSVVVGLQTAVLTCVPVVVIMTIVARVAGQSDEYLLRTIFAGLVIGGLTTIVQAARFGWIGAGNLVIMGSCGAAIGVAVLALRAGGPPLLATLVVTSAIFQFGLAARLAVLRRIFTPVVSGTLTALIAVSIMPLGFAMMQRVPADAPAAAAPVTTIVTVVTVAGLMLRARGILLAWTPVVGLAVGTAVAALFGILDFSRAGQVAWIGLPPLAGPGIGPVLDSRFWLLLPGFLFVTLVITVKQVGDAVLIQRVSRREPRATDFRRVQGAVSACAAGTLLSGIAGTLPVWPRNGGIRLARGVGIAARSVGIHIGIIVIGLAFVPRFAAVLLSIPAPVLGAYIFVAFAANFAQAMRVIFQSNPGRQGAFVAGISFWVGAGIQFRAIFPEYFSGPAGQTLANGIVSGGITVLLLSLFLELTGPRRHRAEMPLGEDSLPVVDKFVMGLAERYRWRGAPLDRLRASAEEAVLSLIRQETDASAAARGLRVVASNDRTGATLEFTAATKGANLENEMVALGSRRPDPTSQRDLSLRLLRFHASSVSHRQYHNADILTVRVARS